MKEKCLRCGEPIRPDLERCIRCCSMLKGQTPHIDNSGTGDQRTVTGIFAGLGIAVGAILLGSYMVLFSGNAKPATPANTAPPPPSPAKPADVTLNSNSASNSAASAADARAKMIREMDNRAKSAAGTQK